MIVLEAYFVALRSFIDPFFLLAMVAGVLAGLIIGIIPGLSGMVGLALALPFVFFMSPQVALPFLIAMHSVTYMGGSITAILLSIPGTPVNAATLIDGFPMAQKGQAARGIGAAVTASGIGSIWTTVFALGMVPLVSYMVMAVRSAEMVLLILIGITFISILGRGSMITGLVSGGMGLLLSFIGFQQVTGDSRFTFGSLYLYDGLPLIPVVLGLFALPEMITLSMKGGTIAQTRIAVKGMLPVLEGVKDVLRHWRLCLQSSIIGYVCGAIPGVGPTTATFVAYGQAKATSKHPDKYGTGVVEGVIASESANDAKEGGALLTTLALGIPGSSGMAVLLGALLMLNIIPGPEMMKEHLPLTLSMILVIAVASVIGAAMCLVLVPQLAKVAFLPARVLVPSISVLIFIGAFARRQDFSDLIVLIIFTVLGLAMKRFGFNSPALILGFVLGGLFERYLFLALGAEGPLFFLRPICLALIFIIIFVFSLGPAKRLLRHWRQKEGRKA